MKINEEIREMQRDRLKKVFDLLRERGILQRNISEYIDCDETYLSSLKSGKLKNIPTSFLNHLHEKYNVNPDFIKGESDFPFDCTGELYKYFEKFTSKWETVMHGNSDYLYLTMDSNFYDFLISVDNVRRSAKTGDIDGETEIDNLKKLYLGNPHYKNFVVIPCEDFKEIISTSKENRKHLSEVLDLISLAEDSE